MQVVIRADAGPEIGGGHVMRCGVLCKALAEFGWEITVAARKGTRPLARRMDRLATDWLTLLTPVEQEPAAMKAAWPNGVDLLIVDQYEWDAGIEAQCRGWAGRIMVIDDMADRKRDADIILNTTPGISAEEYEGLAVTESEILSGPNYALVDDKFARARARSLERRTDSRPEQIYINYGLSDPVNATSAALFALETLTRKLKLDVVIGPACPFAADIADKATSLGATACSGASIDDIVERMADADLALGAAGTTSWERCCLGLPTVVSIIADNQKPNANALANAEAASVLPEELSLDSDAMAKAVERHLIDQPFHGQMARNAATLCDGLGARRVAMALTPALTRDGSRISLRPALHADGERMLKWQLDPVTRAHARNPEPPTRDEHFRWLDAKLGDPDCLFNIVTLDGVPAGVVRLDQFAPEEYEVTIFVAPDKHGKGIAKRAVTLAHRLVPWATIHAYVLPENIASHALFKSAGYAYRGDHYVSAPLRAAA